MEILFAVLGALMVLVVANDIALTVLHPTVRGPLTVPITRAVWRVLRTLASRRFDLPLRLVGPVALGVNLAVWIAGLWLGFALVYLPFEGDFTGPGLDPTGWDFSDALYFSGTSLTTVGFGDLVATTDALQIVTVIEAASGLTVITAAITYLLALFGVLTDLRIASARVADLRGTEVRWAASLAAHGGPGEVRALQRDVIEAEEHLRRFPVVYYFHPKQHNEALFTLLRAGAIACLVLRWGVDGGRLAYAADYGRGLQRSLDRVTAAIAEDFANERPEVAPPLGEADAKRRLRSLREAIAEVDPSLPGTDPPDPEMRAFVARADHFLAALARTHDFVHRPLLD